jgi:hypothetical protein
VRPGLEMLPFPVDPDRSLAVLSHEQVALRAYFISARRSGLVARSAASMASGYEETLFS